MHQKTIHEVYGRNRTVVVTIDHADVAVVVVEIGHRPVLELERHDPSARDLVEVLVRQDVCGVVESLMIVAVAGFDGKHGSLLEVWAGTIPASVLKDGHVMLLRGRLIG